jgi:hypothetical protein
MSDLASTKPSVTRNVASLECHAQGGLLEAVEGPVEPPDHVRARGVHEPRRLTAVDGLSEGAMQEGVLDVELVNWPGPSKGQREHRADGGWLHNRAKGLIVVDSGALSEAPKDPASLVPLQGTIGPPLVRLDPLDDDDVCAGQTGHQIPRLVGDERRVLLHCPTPVGGPAGRCGQRRVPEKPTSLWSWLPGLGAAGYQSRAASPSGERAAGRGEGAVGGTPASRHVSRVGAAEV